MIGLKNHQIIEISLIYISVFNDLIYEHTHILLVLMISQLHLKIVQSINSKIVEILNIIKNLKNTLKYHLDTIQNN